MQKRLSTINMLADLICWLSCGYACVSSLLCITGSGLSAVLPALLLIIPMTLTVWTSIRLKNAAVYTLVHLGMIALLWGIFYAAYRTAGGSFFTAARLIPLAICTGLIIAWYVIFFSKRIQEDRRARYLYTSPFLIALFIVLWIIVTHFGYPQMTSLLLICACIYLVAWFAGSYLENIGTYIASNRQVSNMPVSAILRSSNGLMAIFMLLGIGVMAAFYFLGLDRLVRNAGHLLRLLIAWLIVHAPGGGEETAAETEAVAAETRAAINEVPAFMEEAGESAILVAASDFLMSVARVVLVIVVIVGLFTTLWQLYKRFGNFSFEKKKKGPDEAEPEFEDVVEKLHTGRAAPLRRLFTPKLPEDKIRRIFFKKIQAAHKKDPVDTSLAPSGLTAALSPKDPAAADTFTSLYEKARYGRGETTPEDLAAMKSAAGRL